MQDLGVKVQELGHGRLTGLAGRVMVMRVMICHAANLWARCVNSIVSCV
jgi:hypothetical protein